MIEQRMEQVRRRCAELIAQANQLYNITLPDIAINFNLTGRVAGWAIHHGSRYEMRFNRVMMMNEAWDHIYRETLPHELAHIICFFTRWDRGHGARWRSVCRRLGGNGETYHREAVVYAKGETYVYTSSTGQEIRLSERRHRRVQAGATFIYRGLGRLDRHSPWHRLGDAAATVRPRRLDLLVAELDARVRQRELVDNTVPPAATTFVTQAGSKAERVRAIIRRVKAAGGQPTDAQRLAVQELALTAAYARSCVAFNWPRV